MPIHHIFLFKYKADIVPADVEKVREALRSLPSLVPSIVELKAGKKIKHPLDQDFDDGVILVLKDEDALKDFISTVKTNSEYQASMKPYIQDMLIFDIQVEE